MGQYVQLGRIRAWYDVRGSGEPLLLLHGGLADARNFAANVDAMAARFQVFVPERQGHGHTGDVEGPLTFEGMAEETIAFLETVVGGPAHLVGHSDGAIVALFVALRRPDLVRRVVSIGGNFHYEGTLSGSIDATEISGYVAADYEQMSPDGIEHLPEFAAKVARLWAEEPTLSSADLGRITAPTMVMAGDDDVISLEHTIAMYRAIPDSDLAIVPHTSHLLIMEKPALCNELILDFLAGDQPETGMPIRRHGSR